MSRDQDNTALRKQLAQALEENATLRRRVIKLEIDRDGWRKRYKQESERASDAELERLERKWDERLRAAIGASKSTLRIAEADRRKILNCLHPDRRKSVRERELTEAFQIFQGLLTVDDERC